MKGSRILLALAGVVLGGLLYMRVTRFDRLAAKAEAGAVTSEEWLLLKERPDDARVIAAAAIELREGAKDAECAAVSRVAERAGAVLDAHPTTDDESMAAVAKMLAQCIEPRPGKWTKRAPEDLVKVLHKDLAKAAATPKDVLANALVLLSPRASQELVDLIVTTVRPEDSVGESLLAAGLPENNEKLVGPKEYANRRHAGSDERVSVALRARLGAMKETGPEEVDARALLRVVPFAPSLGLDEAAAKAIAKSIDRVAPVASLCRALVLHPNDAELLKKAGSGPKIDACAAPAQEMRGALDLLDATAAAATQFEDDKAEGAKARRDAWEEEQADAIAKLGPPAIAAAREGLKSNARTVRRVSARAFAKLERAKYLGTITERLHAKSATPDDAKLAFELLLRGAFDAAPVLAAYYLSDVEVVKKATAILRQQKPELWVPMLFADVSVQSASAPGVISGYAAALEQTVGAAPLCAQVLDAAITRAGRPETIFWLTKTLALRALKAKGNAASAPIVEKLLGDKTTYPVLKMRNESFTGEMVEESRTNRTIGELATETLAHVKGR